MAGTTPVRVSVPRTGIRATEIIHLPGFTMDPRTDSHHEVFHVVRGGLEVRLGTERYRVERGDHAIVPAGTIHLLTDVRPATLFMLAIGRSVVEGDADLCELWDSIAASAPVFRARGSTSRALTGLWRTLLALERSEDVSRTRVRKRNALAQLLLDLDDGENDEPHLTSRDRVRDFRRHLVSVSHESWTVERAARACGISVRRFTGLYREVHGTTLVRDLQSIRIENACALLRDGSHSVAGSAYSVGFEDLSHFYRVFNANLGMPPGAWLARQAG